MSEKLFTYDHLLNFIFLANKGANPQRVSTEIIIEIKQLNSGRMASHAFIESVCPAKNVIS